MMLRSARARWPARAQETTLLPGGIEFIAIP